MGVRKCSITDCHSVSGRQEHRGVTFHSFPINPITRTLWIENCALPETKVITKSTLVCSRHFRRADFQPLKNDKYLLRQGAVPTIFPWGTKPAIPLPALRTLGEDFLKAAASVGIAVPSTAVDTVATSSPTNISSTSLAAVTQEQQLIDSNNSTEVLSAINPEFKSPPLKRSASADNNGKASTPGQRAKIPRKSLDASGAAGRKKSSTKKSQLTPKSDQPRIIPISFDPVSLFLPGSCIEAQDFKEIWHTAKVVEVDHNEREVLIHFESSTKERSAGLAEEWISMNSSRLRPIQQQPQPQPKKQQHQQTSSKKSVTMYEVGERVHAKWTDSRKFPATVQKILDNNMYEVLFDDGYMKIVKGIAMSKVKGPTATVSTPSNIEQNLQQITQTPSSLTTPQKPSTSTGGGRKSQPPLPIPKFDLTKFNLLPVPKDGEWCCNWVNDTPIGEEGYLEGPDGHRRPTVLVEDWRLPVGWTKHLYQRSSVSGKWDVVLVGPNKKRFRSKADVKVYLEENGEQYNPDVYDFSIHKRRSKDIGLYVMTDEYKEESEKKKIALQSAAAAKAAAADLDTKSVQELLPKESKLLSILSESTSATTATTSSDATTPSTGIADISAEEMFPAFPPPTELQQINSDVINAFTKTSPSPPPVVNKKPITPSTPVTSAAVTATSTAAPIDPPLTPSQQLELGFVYVGALKVKIVDNLFRCPDSMCSKNFRKENHLQIHVKS